MSNINAISNITCFTFILTKVRTITVLGKVWRNVYYSLCYKWEYTVLQAFWRSLW